MKPTINQIEKWVQALESGKYKQGQKALQTIDNKFCCLGVACDIFIPKIKKTWYSNGNRLFGDYPEDQAKAPKWLKDIDSITHLKIGIPLVDLNDKHNLSFSEIATVLELLYIHKALD